MHLEKIEHPSIIRKIICAIIGMAPPLIFMFIKYHDLMIKTVGSSVSMLFILIIVITAAANRKKLPIPDNSGIPIALIVIGLICKFIGDMVIYLGIVQIISIAVSNIFFKWRIRRGKDRKNNEVSTTSNS